MRRIPSRLASCSFNHPLGWEWGNCGCANKEQCLLGEIQFIWPETNTRLHRVNPFNLWLFHRTLQFKGAVRSLAKFLLRVR